MGLFDDLLKDFKEIGDELAEVKNDLVASIKDSAADTAEISDAAKKKVNTVKQRVKKTFNITK